MWFLRLLAVCSLLAFSNTVFAVEFGLARHLLARTGFGPGLNDIQALSDSTYEQAVDDILDAVRRETVTPPPSWVNESLHPGGRMRDLSQTQRKQFRKANRERQIQLKAWWMQEMLVTPTPLTERMTLFWHGHFTSSMKKVRAPQLMYVQNRLLRKHALGNFADLLRAIVRDPAMTLYLDNVSNRRGKPNENFARELLELFTLGEGYYSEEDIKQAARAFTGWSVNRKTGSFQFRKRQHDHGVKRFLGEIGNWDGDDIIDVLLRQPSLSRHIVNKLWMEMVGVAASERRLSELARGFRKTNYEIRPLLRRILLSAEFRAPDNRGQRIKSPVEFLVGSLRVLGIVPRNSRFLVRATRRLGQDLMDPPNVKGWPGGTTWLDSNTWLLRQTLLSRLTREMARGGARKKGMKRETMMNGLPAMQGSSRRSNLQDLPAGLRTALLLPLPPIDPVDPGHEPALSQLLRDPVFQLK